MERSTEEADDVLNANRNVARDETPAPTASASRAAAPAPTVDQRPQAFDWKKLWPWLLAAVVLILIVWLLTRKGRGTPAVVG